MYQITFLQRNHWRGVSINRKWVYIFIIYLLIGDLARGQELNQDSGKSLTDHQFPKSRLTALLETRNTGEGLSEKEILATGKSSYIYR